jgi:putative hydrolase of the HAD superfamily
VADPGVGPPVRAVLLDVDFTIAKPGPLLGPEGYRRAGLQFGLSLDPDRYEEARRAAVEDLEMHPELDHDEEVWIRFTEDIIRAMGGEGPDLHRVAVEIVDGWEHAENFELYEDALPTLAELRRHGLRLALVSNTSRDLDAFVGHFEIDVDAWISSRMHGKVKPSPTIFLAALELVGAEPGEAVMVGDSPADDVDGARALGIRAFLLDREGRFPEAVGRLDSLMDLPPALGLGSR